MRTTVEPLIVEQGDAVFLDLTGVTFLDSSGLGTLVGLQKRANHAHSRLILCGPSQQMQKVIDVTHLRDAFTILPAVPGLDGASSDNTDALNG